jgi:hypothetical protein
LVGPNTSVDLRLLPSLSVGDAQAVAHHARAKAVPPVQYVWRTVPSVAPGAVEHHSMHGAPATEQVQVAAT